MKHKHWQQHKLHYISENEIYYFLNFLPNTDTLFAKHGCHKSAPPQCRLSIVCLF